MRIQYKDKKLEKVCTDATAARKKYGPKMAEEIQTCIDALSAAESVELLIQWRICRCHPLTGDRKGQFAMDLVQPYRLIFEKGKDGSLFVYVIEIIDYH